MPPGKGASSSRPIFVIGCPRSGTTLLQLMLHSHRRLAVAPETRFVLPAYATRCEFGDLQDRNNRRSLARWITDGETTKFRELGLKPAKVVEAITEGPPTLGSALNIVFSSYARRFDKPRWGDKRPSYLRHVDTLLRMFPDAQFVHLIRDGRDCVASLKEMPWFKRDVHHAVSSWREAIDHGRRYAGLLGPGTYYEMQYERLVADPAEELKGLCAFLGEEFDPAMTEPQGFAKLTVPSHKKWHRLTHDAVTDDRVGSWSKRLEPWELGLAEAAFGDRLTDYGYEPSGAPRPPAAQLARFARTVARRRLAQCKFAIRERVQRRREPGPVEYVLDWDTPALT